MKKLLSLRNISAIAIFTALAVILYCVPGLQFQLPFTPSFLKIHLEEIPILISSFAYGPFVGFCVLFLKTLIKLPMDLDNLMIGALADFVYGLFLVIPASLIYKKMHNFKGAMIGLGVGLVSNLLVSCVVGLYTVFPLYRYVYGDTVLAMFNAIDSSIESLYDPKIMYEFLLPFNLIKDAIVILATLVCYKPLKAIINRNGHYKKIQEKSHDEETNYLDNQPINEDNIESKIDK